MATRVWGGFTDGSWGQSTNWEGNAVPTHGDSVIVRADSTRNISAYDVTSTALADFAVQEGFGYNIGTSTANLHLALAAVTFAYDNRLVSSFVVGESLSAGANTGVVSMVESLGSSTGYLGLVNVSGGFSNNSTVTGATSSTTADVNGTATTGGSQAVNIGGTGTYYLDLDGYGTVTITEAGAAPGTGQWGCNMIGELYDSTLGTINVRCGQNETVSIGATAGDSMEVNQINVSGNVEDLAVGANVTEYDGATAPDMTINNGTKVVTKCALGAVTQRGGTWYHESGAVTSPKIHAGVCYYNSNGTITTPTVGGGGTLDFSQDLRSKTVSGSTTLYAGATLNDPDGVVTFGSASQGIDFVECDVGDVTVQLGKNIRITRSVS